MTYTIDAEDLDAEVDRMASRMTRRTPRAQARERRFRTSHYRPGQFIHPGVLIAEPARLDGWQVLEERE